MRFILAVLSITTLLLVGAGTSYVYLSVLPPGTTDVEVTIPPDASIKTAGRLLEEAGVITTKYAFIYFARREQAEIKPGTYRFLTGIYPWVAVKLLEKGPPEDPQVRVTFPEGIRLEEFADRLDAAGVVDRAEFLALARDRAFVSNLVGRSARDLEGYLFPSTYRFAPESDAEDVINRLYAHLITALPDSRPGGLDTHQFITLASIVEKEARVAEERPRIAAVFLNRLDRGMALAADPTIRYALNRWDTKPVLYVDLEVVSPYNTYRYPGLPPGPISSVGRASLNAVAEPLGSDELFFVALPDGRHLFSKTFAEHRANIARIKRMRAERNAG